MPAVAVGADADLVDARRTLLPQAELAAARAGDPEATQRAYDAARDLQEALRRSTPVSAACRPLLAAMARYAAARVREMEGIDRPSAADRSTGQRAAARDWARIPSLAGGCRGAGGGGGPVAPPAISPSDGEAFFGTIVARAPTGADSAELVVSGQAIQRVAVRGGRARFSVSGAGRYDLRVLFSGAGRALGATETRGAVALPASARRAEPGRGAGVSLVSRLARAAAGAPAYRAAWVQDLTSGEVAGMNAGAPFPAASTVKLGLLAGSLARLGATPERSVLAYDLKAMTTWSSNLAANRLVRRLGSGVATEGLRRLGARSSTYPGEYIVGTELQPSLPQAAPGAAPPGTSARVTTARDLARMLYSLHAAAVGARGARAETGLTAHQARLALGWLASSQQRGDNVSLLAGGLPGGTVVAQKNGWISSARHAAGILYTPRGPAIAVFLSYDGGGVPLAAARPTASAVARLAASLP